MVNIKCGDSYFISDGQKQALLIRAENLLGEGGSNPCRYLSCLKFFHCSDDIEFTPIHSCKIF